jgi:hypothetical protein
VLVLPLSACHANVLSSFCFLHMGAYGSLVVKALCYKLQDRRFETEWGELIFLNLPNPSGSTRSREIMFLGSKVQLVCRAYNLAAICKLIV